MVLRILEYVKEFVGRYHRIIKPQVHEHETEHTELEYYSDIKSNSD